MRCAPIESATAYSEGLIGPQYRSKALGTHRGSRVTATLGYFIASDAPFKFCASCGSAAVEAPPVGQHRAITMQRTGVGRRYSQLVNTFDQAWLAAPDTIADRPRLTILYRPVARDILHNLHVFVGCSKSLAGSPEAKGAVRRGTRSQQHRRLAAPWALHAHVGTVKFSGNRLHPRFDQIFDMANFGRQTLNCFFDQFFDTANSCAFTELTIQEPQHKIQRSSVLPLHTYRKLASGHKSEVQCAIS
jgi:hypothetical protein